MQWNQLSSVMEEFSKSIREAQISVNSEHALSEFTEQFYSAYRAKQNNGGHNCRKI